MQQKSTKPWIILIVAPFIALITNAIVQLIVRFATSGSGESTSNIAITVVNIVSLLIGIAAVIGMFGLPIWITMLVIAINHNNKIKQSPSKRPRQ